ncbi:MAG TPA: DNA primase, partial [Burkholderiaceae bacterium]
GAIKRQLLGEIADLVQLGSHELGDLWGLAPPPRAGGPASGYKNNSNSAMFNAGQRQKTPQNPAFGAPRRVAGRSAPPRREDRALCLLFTAPGAWEALSHEEHALLCALPEPHGALFGWLDSQSHEHGPQHWGALRESLRDQPFGDVVVRLVTQTPADIEYDPAELQYVLRELAIADLEAERSRLAPLAAADPQAYARYRLLDARYRQLKAGQKV